MTEQNRSSVNRKGMAALKLMLPRAASRDNWYQKWGCISVWSEDLHSSDHAQSCPWMGWKRILIGLKECRVNTMGELVNWKYDVAPGHSISNAERRRTTAMNKRSERWRTVGHQLQYRKRNTCFQWVEVRPQPTSMTKLSDWKYKRENWSTLYRWVG